MVDDALQEAGVEPDLRPEIIALDTNLPLEIRSLAKFDKGFRLSSAKPGCSRNHLGCELWEN